MVAAFLTGIPVEVIQQAGVVPRCRRAAIVTPLNSPHNTRRETVGVFYKLSPSLYKFSTTFPTQKLTLTPCPPEGGGSGGGRGNGGRSKKWRPNRNSDSHPLYLTGIGPFDM